MTASGHGELPGKQGIANAVDGIGRGQKIATGHVESGLGETGIDPKIATAHGATARGRTATKKTTASDALDRSTTNGKQERRPRSRELSDRERALQSFLVPRSEDRETQEDRERERSTETSFDSSHRGVCCDEQGEATEEAARAGEVRCGWATSLSAAPEGAEETEARSRATDERPETLPPPLAKPRLSGRRGSLTGHNTRCTPRSPPPPPSYPALLKGGKKKRRKSRAAELPKKFPRGAKPPAQGEQSLKGETFFVLCKFVFWRKVPTTLETNQHKSHVCKFCPYT